ncbi:hypothetical protein PIB30_071158 [Stylosanthes scabra]|uniref:Uncharacterized protein n=1 Tax=Stylosanthes scabra TaxID=79078 RepID=A0ABU6VMB4_9FABA|nr:hypothetical protein [Stylosanthes scabra]
MEPVGGSPETTEERSSAVARARRSSRKKRSVGLGCVNTKQRDGLAPVRRSNRRGSCGGDEQQRSGRQA